jgi:MFS family permease
MVITGGSFDSQSAPWHLWPMSSEITSPAPPPSTNALHYRPYVFQLLALGLHGFAVQIMAVAISWQVWDRTHNAVYLGLIGLSQFLPALALVLVTGLVADRFNRRVIVGACLVLEFMAALGLLWFTNANTQTIAPVFAVMVLLGTARAFFNPASDALTPNLLAKEAIPHAISLNSMNWQITTITGPVLGGLLYGFSGALAYGVPAVLIICAIVAVGFIGRIAQENHVEETTVKALLAGFRFIKSEKIVLGAISLDLFAVLLGGTYALLPIYASDVLHAEEAGALWLGFLRASPGIGAMAMAAWLAKFGIRDHAGYWLFVCVAAFGVFTLLFGMSTWLPLSIFALALVGAFDMVSVYIRETLMQLWTPDSVRGRVNAVNRVFIGASNEMGEFRAGLVAARFGAVTAVMMGGIGTVVVAGLWSRLFPELRTARKLEVPEK